jgi:hypothetical protein
MQERAGGGSVFTFRQHFAHTTSLACKSEPGVVPFLRFDGTSPAPPPSHAKASRRWSSCHISTALCPHHLPRTQKRAGGGLLFTFRRRHANTSLARKSEPEVVPFSSFDDTSPTPPPSHARASRGCSSFHVLTMPCQHHLPRKQKRTGGALLFMFRRHLAHTTSLACKSEPEVVLSHFDDASPTSPPSHAKASRRWSFFRISTPPCLFHLPCNFRRHLTYSTSLACTSELVVVFFSYFDATSPTPPPSHAEVSWRWFFFMLRFFHVSTSSRVQHLFYFMYYY